MNIIKNKATKALLSVSMATTLFFTANVSGSIANAQVGDINYPIPTTNFKEYSHFDELASNNKNKSSSLKGKTIILTTNDVHGAIEGYPYLAGLKKTLKDKYQANVLVIDAGDFSNDKKKPIYTTPDNCNAIDLMNKVGYDVATLGNHEFYKAQYLKGNIERATFKVINANVTQENTFDFIKNHKITLNEDDPKNKITIGFFGVATPDVTTFDPKVSVAVGDKLLNISRDQVTELKNSGSDIVICLAHLGLEDAFEKDQCRSVDVYNALTKGNAEQNIAPVPLDLIVDGHSHSTITPPQKGEPEREKILSTGTEFENIGVIVIDNNDKAIEETFLLKTKNLPKNLRDSDVQKDVDKIISQTK